MNYEGLSFGPEELTSVMRSIYEELLTFISTPSFRALFKELMDLPPKDRPDFVTKVLLNEEELKRRHVDVPEGILIQMSAFGDRRPTLFAVKKFLPDEYRGAWRNCNITFFNEFKDDEISRDPADAWRMPLPVNIQNELIAEGIDLNQAPTTTEFGIKPSSFETASSAPE
jgi:hypothetical protein